MDEDVLVLALAVEDEELPTLLLAQPFVLAVAGPQPPVVVPAAAAVVAVTAPEEDDPVVVVLAVCDGVVVAGFHFRFRQ